MALHTTWQRRGRVQCAASLFREHSEESQGLWAEQNGAPREQERTRLPEVRAHRSPSGHHHGLWGTEARLTLSEGGAPLCTPVPGALHVQGAEGSSAPRSEGAARGPCRGCERLGLFRTRLCPPLSVGTRTAACSLPPRGADAGSTPSCAGGSLAVSELAAQLSTHGWLVTDATTTRFSGLGPRHPDVRKGKLNKQQTGLRAVPSADGPSSPIQCARRWPGAGLRWGPRAYSDAACSPCRRLGQWLGLCRASRCGSPRGACAGRPSAGKVFWTCVPKGREECGG